MKNIYTLLKLSSIIKSRRIKLLGIYLLHISARRYLGLFLDPILGCNFRCQMCYFSDPEHIKRMHGSFTKEDLENLAASFFPYALKLQIGCGAEPTIYPNLIDIIKLGKKYNVPYISLTTNGNLLSLADLESMFLEGLDEITISTHGLSKQTYETLMKNGSFELFTALLENFKTCKSKFPNIKIRINYTINESNINDLSLFDSVFSEIPIDIVQLRPIQQIGNSEYNNFSMAKIKQAYSSIILPIVKQCKSKNITCIYPEFEHLDILSEETEQKEKDIESFTYCYLSPNGCFEDDFDIHTDTFRSYCRKTHRDRLIFSSIFKRKQKNIDKKHNDKNIDNKNVDNKNVNNKNPDNSSDTNLNNKMRKGNYSIK